jgi:hypothetical protein
VDIHLCLWLSLPAEAGNPVINEFIGGIGAQVASTVFTGSSALAGDDGVR